MKRFTNKKLAKPINKVKKNSLKSLTLKNKNSGKPIERYISYDKDEIKRDLELTDNQTIFVSIASYRDKYCRYTIADCFQKAKFPGRIFVGVCEQNDISDEDCLKSKTADIFKDNIRIMRVNADEAKGPMYARGLIEENLYKNELYYLIIDSHMLFVDDWDEKVIQQLLICPSKKPILTCYPNTWDGISFASPGQNIPAPFLKFNAFDKRRKIPTQVSSNYKKNESKYPISSISWAAGFSFTLGRVIKEVPYDLNCQYIFLGEETSMAARLYTNGWDLYHPLINIVFHLTDRSYRPLFWERFHSTGVKSGVIHRDISKYRKEIGKKSLYRLQSLLFTLNDIDFGKYGLGTERSLNDYEKYAGVFFKKQKFAKRALFGLTKNPSIAEINHKKGKFTK
jgi:[Skp1-protein]-hydroxyproline N-acetylglucosaminyltransferase